MLQWVFIELWVLFVSFSSHTLTTVTLFVWIRIISNELIKQLTSLGFHMYVQHIQQHKQTTECRLLRDAHHFQDESAACRPLVAVTRSFCPPTSYLCTHYDKSQL